MYDLNPLLRIALTSIRIYPEAVKGFYRHMDITEHHRNSSGTKSRYFVWTLALSLIFTLAAVPTASAMPAAKQAGVFKKIFNFNKGLRGKKVKVLAVYDDATKADIDAMTSAFSSGGITATAVDAAGALSGLAGAEVVYLLANLPEVLAECQAQKKLTITATPTLTEGGHVAVSVGDNGGRAVITVHLKRVKSEGQVFAPTFLKMAKVVR